MATLKLNLTKWNPPGSILKPYPLFYDNGIKPAAGGVDQLISDIRDDLASLDLELLNIGADSRIENWLFVENDTNARPAILGDINGFAGAIFRKAPQANEIIYLQHRARNAAETVNLGITAPTPNTAKGIVFSVGVSDNLYGPWDTYLPAQPLSYSPTGTKVQILPISLASLNISQNYYFRVSREYGNSGDTLSDAALLTVVRTA